MSAYQRKNQQKDLFEMLPDAIAAFKKNIIDPFFGDGRAAKYDKDSPPLRAELFTEKQLENHAGTLARKHKLITGPPSELLLKRLAENEKVLLEVHALLTETVKQGQRIAPAGEWLLDNFYLVEEQVYTGKKHLPKGYSRGLPQLARGESAGLPRVYDIAVEIISHSDGHVDLNSLLGFINAYQKTTYLKLGELWAIPIMLRLALLENMRRIAIQIAIDLAHKSLADKWADEMIGAAEKDPKNLVIVIADMARSAPPMESPFVAELIRRLQEKGNSLTLPLNWIEQHLTEQHLTSSELVQQDNQKQAADQVSISNSINSLRFLSTTDWREFVETCSVVEQTLREDIDGIYNRMDFHTRDRYRHSVEKMAKHSDHSEQEVAAIAIQVAREAQAAGTDNRAAHVGYHLIGRGIYQLEKRIKVKYSSWEKMRRWSSRHPFIIYGGGILLMTILLSWAFLSEVKAEGLDRWLWISVGLLSLVAASKLAVAVANWLSTKLARPYLLPRMDFSKGITSECRTMVVIPTLLSSQYVIDELIEAMEVRFLANRDEYLQFALLTDFRDADKETMPEDEDILSTARNRIIALNKKYRRNSNDTFFIFHRPRQWNPKEKKWIGYERKRGKLGALNALIQHNDTSAFSMIVGDEHIYNNIKYVITLDTDTQLPRDAAWKMVAAMAHPMNHPYYNEKKKRVTEGYTILQPRVSNSLPGNGSSFYARIHGNEPGTDPYTRAISDVYQDLFKEGSFIGKGIYEVNAFEQSLADRFPENRILSHDLLEGSYARAGLMTDVQLYEEYPSRYAADMQRRHRWIRGDWQIATWILPFVPDHQNKLRKNPISNLSKWKIADNLRRSLVPLTLMLLLIFGWTLSPAPVFWTFTVLSLIILPTIINFTWELFFKPADVIFSQHFIYTFRSVKDQLYQHLVDIACLPYETWMNLDAIVRTIGRVYFTRRNLLQWNPYGSSAYDQKSLFHSFRTMWINPVLAIALLFYCGYHVPFTLIMAVPFISLWCLAPFISWWMSRPIFEHTGNLSQKQNIYLRILGRKIWAFFEKFVSAEDNWLPPDNYQEEPVERIAHRTSPTNMGLSLLANFTAYDFGYITASQVVERTANGLNTMLRMERFRGHFFNWYDTQSLAPLSPKYISTVDSGNLSGHLITLQQGLLALPDKKIITHNHVEGLLDAVRILIEKTKSPKLLQDFLSRHQDTEHLTEKDITETKAFLDEFEKDFNHIITEMDLDPDDEDDWWAQKIISQLGFTREFINSFVPWISLPSAPEKFKKLIPDLPAVPTLHQLARIEQSLLQKIVSGYTDDNTKEENDWLTLFRDGISKAGHRAKELILQAEQLATKAAELSVVEYDFLYDRSQHLLTIGYNVDEHRRDNSFYDLLASEARLTTFTAIAQGKLPQESWFALGRQLTNVGTTPILLSWSGSMFEYLMPLLVMPTYENTLLDQTGKAVVQKQIEYGRKRGIPWGISESGYNMVDANLNYQYKAFGVPGVGFKRGLGEDLVIAPYATIMSLMVAPQESYDNLLVMKEAGFEGKYGFYEAVDYTSARLLRRQTHYVVRSFMAHHQGMSFLSLAYLLFNRPMQERFASQVQVKATLLLLQERIPRVTNFYSPSVHAEDISILPANDTSMRVIKTPHTVIPEVQLLSNGKYNVMVTNAGGGYSKWKNIALTRWREDSTCDNWGTFCFIRDLDNNEFWSSAYQPALKQGDNYEAVFSQGRAEFRRRDLSLETHTEIVVSPEDDIELRRLHLINRSRKKRIIEITSYAEVILATAASDEAHPAFSNLFVQTELNEQRNAILCTRRPRSADEQSPWMFHLMKAHDATVTNISYETDRDAFIGRGFTINDPKVMNGEAPLSNSNGSVLDPVISIQYRIVIEPQASATVDMIFGVAETKESCNTLIDKYQDRFMTNRVLELAWTHSQVILRQINALESDAQLYARLASSIIFSNASMRTDPAIILKNQRGQSGLWSYSISGDIPIVLLQIEDANNVDLVKQLVQAHAYWRLKGLSVDLVIWNEDHGGYRQVLHNQIQSLVAPGMIGDVKDKPGGIFIRSSDQISNEDRILFQTVAHVVLSDRLGTLEEQMNRRSKTKSSIPYFSPSKFYPSVTTAIPAREDLTFFNGYGGFTKDGKEYVITTTPQKSTPAPWINVIANASFGSVISENGQAYTWLENAHSFRITPWNNDPIGDLKGEAFYLRDEESGRFWSPSPLPCRGKSPYITRHGFGYSVFEHSEDGINSEMWMYVDTEASVKFIVIKLKNNSQRTRRISATGYVEWVLGDQRAKYMMHTITQMDTRSGAIIASNAYNTELDNRVAFFDVDDANKGFTTDRAEFIGRNNNLSSPDAMNRSRLSGKIGAAYDPCAALQVAIELGEEEEHQVIFRLGAGRNYQDAIQLINKFAGETAAQEALDRVHAYWNKTLTNVQIQSPDPALNLLANGWLNYQTLACRIWARSGFYQSGGAFGFRDQLQDVISLVHTQPQLVRDQVILCASRQFREGDVQHWWHPPLGRGVRTTCSDDYLWLPYICSRYIMTTGDTGILDEQIHFLEGRLLNIGEESYYDLPIRSDQSASLYEHCCKAIQHGLRFGTHGLPLMGSGDWNDGMDKVGQHGKGESVWLAFFLYDILNRFAEVAILRKDDAFAATCKREAEQLQKNIRENAWDGDWYRRAYFDDGTPLGSKENEECRIDSIAQSWSVISKGGDPDRSAQALASAHQNLVREDMGIIQLFDPPFNRSTKDPGYIQGYVPGVRENGGQYTHAAIWLVMAFAESGQQQRTWELLQMINPVNRGIDAEKIAVYKTEPYVIAADVYAEPAHKGRGGWTWYTGSAGWMYQMVLESFIGLKKLGDKLYFNPCLPKEWPSVQVSYRFYETTYQVTLRQTAGEGTTKITVNGEAQDVDFITLKDDQQTHEVTIEVYEKTIINNQPPQNAKEPPLLH